MTGLPPQQVSQMYALYQQGFTLDEVGAQFYYTGAAIWHIFRRNGLLTRKAGKRSVVLKSLPQINRMYRDYQAGMSLQAVGTKYGLSLWSVRRRFQVCNLEIRPPNGA